MQAPPIRKRGVLGFTHAYDKELGIDAIVLGSENCLVDPGGRLRIAKGPGSSAGRGDTNAFLAGAVVAGCTVKLANVSAYRETTYLIAGDSGTAYIEGLGTFPILSYTTVIISGAQYPLAIPVPVLTAITPSYYVDPGQPSGGVTARMTFYRSTTKGESNASEATANVILDSEKLYLQIPARSNASIDQFRIYLSKQGEGPLQINYFYDDFTYGTVASSSTVSINGVPTTVYVGGVPTGGGVMAIDYNDADLNTFRQAPYVLNAAPDSQFIAVMGAHSVAHTA
jgi:hypothetical protein